MFLFLLACFQKPLITEDNLLPIAKETMKVAHPTADLVGTEIIGSENSAKHGRYVDIKMRYQPVMQDIAVLSVRYNVLSTEPCKIDVEVLSDTGNIPPVLLNEWAAEPALSKFICNSQPE